MQRPSEAKRESIARAAAELFAARPYHEVRQEDIAERAGVGKGTLYVYFRSKEDLYLALAREGFALVARVRIACRPPRRMPGAAAMIFGELTGFASSFPELHAVMRNTAAGPADPGCSRPGRSWPGSSRALRARASHGERGRVPRPDARIVLVARARSCSRSRARSPACWAITCFGWSGTGSARRPPGVPRDPARGLDIRRDRLRGVPVRVRRRPAGGGGRLSRDHRHRPAGALRGGRSAVAGPGDAAGRFVQRESGHRRGAVRPPRRGAAAARGRPAADAGPVQCAGAAGEHGAWAARRVRCGPERAVCAADGHGRSARAWRGRDSRSTLGDGRSTPARAAARGGPGVLTRRCGPSGSSRCWRRL